MTRIETGRVNGYIISTWSKNGVWHGTATSGGRVVDCIELVDRDLPKGLTDHQKHRTTKRALLYRLHG